MEKMIEVVSLFSGIGGFEEGLKLAKINNKIVFASEIDSFAKKSYEANFKTENLNGDITKIREDEVAEHDLLLAGFPCQAFSIAGKRKGFEDIRGTLFYDIARILNKKKPKYFLLENVKNLISHDNGKTIEEILSVLNDLGYTVDFTVINSMESGVPQNRDRTYICGIFEEKTSKYAEDFRNSKVHKLKMELNKREHKGFNFFSTLSYDNKQLYIEDVIVDNVGEKYFLNNILIDKFLDKIKLNTIKKNEKKIIKILDLPKEVHNDLERQRRVYSIKGISPTVLARSDSTKILLEESSNYKIRKITPEENFYIQGFDKSFVNNIKKIGMSDTQMYKQSGNAVSPPVIAGILKKLYREFMIND